MTTLKVGSIEHPTSGSLATINGTAPSNRNLIINGNFDVWQRDTSFTGSVSGTSAYTADRWKAGGGTSTTVSRQTFTLGQTDVPGEPTYYAQWAITNNSQNYEFQQRIEDVRTLAGQKATISFYARRTTGSITVGVRTVQYFGTGGSPSSSVVVSAGTPSLTTSWQKFTYTVDIGSVSGKTLGSDNNHALWVGFQVNDTNTGTIEIAQFQVEAGSVATPFEHRSFGDELLRCQRYYQTSFPYGDAIAANSNYREVHVGGRKGNLNPVGYVPFISKMRATPSVTVWNNHRDVTGSDNAMAWYNSSNSWSSATSFNANIDMSGFSFSPASGGGSSYAFYFNWEASAEL